MEPVAPTGIPPLQSADRALPGQVVRRAAEEDQAQYRQPQPWGAVRQRQGALRPEVDRPQEQADPADDGYGRVADRAVDTNRLVTGGVGQGEQGDGGEGREEHQDAAALEGIPGELRQLP